MEGGGRVSRVGAGFGVIVKVVALSHPRRPLFIRDPGSSSLSWVWAVEHRV